MAWNLMIRAAIKTVGNYFYLLPTYSQARKVIWDSITIQGDRFLDYIPKELITNLNQQEMKIRLINGSLIQLCGSDTYDNLVGTNPRGIVFSEYSLQDPRAYQFLRPVLMANDGWAFFLFCVSGNTLVLGSKGFQRINKISPSRYEFSDLNKPIWGIGGFHNAVQFYYGGKKPTLKITLECGYQIECTSIHPLWDGNKWIKAQDLTIGQFMPIQYGQDVWGDGLDISDFYFRSHGLLKRINFSVSDPDFFYLLGLIHADGNYNATNVCVTKKKDPEIIDFVNKYGFRTHIDGIHHTLSSSEFCGLLEYLGFKHGARNKSFPERLLECTKEEMKSFIQGLFDGDGTSNSNPNKRGYIKLTSTCLDFMQDLQIILLNFGIVSGLRSEDKAPTNKVKVWSRIYNLEITGYFANIFYRDIGFRLQRKQKNNAHVPDSCKEEPGNVYPIDISQLSDYKINKNIISNPHRISRRTIRSLNEKNSHPYLQSLLSEKLFYSPIKEIVNSENEVFDFVIPETNSFFSNGFLSHNTPRGKNSAYELYQIASNNPKDWYCTKLTVLDTRHISLHDIEKEKAEGLMSDDLIQQEFYTSFDMGVEGSYYSKYMDKMRVAGQIGIVPWEPAFKVNTFWDLGVRDNTTIIFAQNVGTTLRIIDCYEKSKEGLEHYVNILNSKPYTYGIHVAPHDIAVQEFGSGITRIEKARQLGINFIIADNIPIPDGIESVRSTFARMWIDQEKCAPLIKALENYRQEYDVKRQVYKPQPLHDRFSHFADAARYMCVSLPKTRDRLSADDLDRLHREALYGANSNMPSVFRDDLPMY